MKTRMLVLAPLFLIITSVGTAFATEHENKKLDFSFQQPTPEEMQAGMQKWMEMSKPSHMHRRLEYFLGDWQTETKMYGMGPSAETSAGKATYSWLMEDHWLKQDFSGSFMGMPFTGMGLWGYDNYRKQFVGMWVDSMSTVMATMSGMLDKTGETLIAYGTMDEPMFDQIGKAVKYITRIVDEDVHVFELHDLSIGEENTLVLEITYKRVK